MRPEPEPRWSPFPVQDWSTMPPPAGPETWDEPAALVVPDTAAPDAPNTSDPPAELAAQDAPDVSVASGSPVRRWLAPVVILLVFALSVGGMYALARASRGVDPPSSRFLPDDGAGWTSRVSRTAGFGGDQTDRRSTTTFDESARLGGIEATQTVAPAFGSELLGAMDLGRSISAAEVWRVSSSETESGADASQTTNQIINQTTQRLRFYRVDRGVELLADSGPDGSVVYRPGLRELPADPRAGSSWSSSGSAGPGLTYRADLRLDRVDAGCLVVSGKLRLASAGVAAARDHELERRWCPGRGLVSSSDRVGTGAAAQSVTEQTVPDVDPSRTGIPSLASAATRWRSAASWTSQDEPVTVADPAAAAGPLPALPSDLAPVPLASGQLVRTVRQGRDLLIMNAPTGTSFGWRVVRRLHPAGDPTVLVAFGDLVVVGTSDRTLSAYGVDGWRRWRIALDDTVTTAPARSGASLVVVTAAGTVSMIDLADGHLRWTTSVGSDVSAGLVADGSVVVVADRSGGLSGLRPADGSLLWKQNGDTPTQLTLFSSPAATVLVVVDGSNLDGRTAGTGRLLWRRPYRGTWRADAMITAAGSGSTTNSLVVATSQQLMAMDETGRELWRRPGAAGLATDGRQLVVLGSGSLQVLDPTGSVTENLALAAVRGSSTRSMITDRDGVLISSSGSTELRKWS